jgi:hypothetical protein
VDNKGGPETKQSDSDPIPVKISMTVNNMSRDGLNRFKGNNKDDSLNTKTDCIYIGNIGKKVEVLRIVSFLEYHKVEVIDAQLIPSRIHNCNGARIVVAKGQRDRMLSPKFLPSPSYARIWYPKQQDLHRK